MPLYGHELTETINPYAAGVGWAVKLDKGDFVGRDGSADVKAAARPGPRRPAPRRQADRPPGGGRARRRPRVGLVTSGTFSPTLQQSLAMALVDRRTPRRSAPSSRSTSGGTASPPGSSSCRSTTRPEPVESTATATSRRTRSKRTHPWTRRRSGSPRPTSGSRLEGDVATIGISQFAVDQLTDLIMIDLPAVGTKLAAGKSFGEIESVKAVSDLYAPVGGEVIEVNDEVAEQRPAPRRRPLRQGLADQGPGRRPVGHRAALDHEPTRRKWPKKVIESSWSVARVSVVADVDHRRACAVRFRPNNGHRTDGQRNQENMAYIANTPDDVRVMLGAIGLDSLDQLFDMIPPDYRLKRPLASRRRLAELELTEHDRRTCWRRTRAPIGGSASWAAAATTTSSPPSSTTSPPAASSTRRTRPIRPRRARGRCRRRSSTRR